MTSEFFAYNHSFDKIIDNDPVKNSWGDYWYLNGHPYEKYAWSTEVFSVKEIFDIITLGKRLNTQRATTGGNGVNCLDHRKSFVSWISPNEKTSWIFERLTNTIRKHNEKYFNYDLTMIEKLQFTYYSSEEEGMYKQHIDPLEWSHPHNRKLSLVLQLSDPSEYEGGELRLYHGHIPTIIKKELGLLVSFPSYTLHEVTPVTKGERYSLVVWVHGPAFK
jgi:PKHD-type hydroxylase